MNDYEKNKGASLKYFLFIGIPVIIVLGVLGAYYQMTNPLKVLTKTINEVYNKVDNVLKEPIDYFNINETPFSINGNLSFKTDLELYKLEELQKYNYNFSFDMDLKQELVIATLGLQEEEMNILDAIFYQIGNEQYLESKTLFDQMLKMPKIEEEFNDIFDFSDFGELNDNLNDFKYLLKKAKESLENSLDKKYLTREKTDITLNGRQVKTTKITYLLDKENQERTTRKMASDFMKDQKSLEILAKINNTTEEEIMEQLKKDFTYKCDYSIILYTEGWNQNIVRISLLENAIEKITFLNTEENQSILFENDIILNLKSYTDENIEIDYQIKSSNISGKMKIENKRMNQNKTESKLNLTISSSDLNLEINLNLNGEKKEKIEKPDITNAKEFESLSPSEIGTILENLENALEETIFYNLFESTIM